MVFLRFFSMPTKDCDTAHIVINYSICILGVVCPFFGNTPPRKRESMKILVVCQYYYPEQFHVTDVCEQLVRDGHTVTVLTGLPNYPSGIIPEEYRHGKRRNETINGVRVIRCFEIGRKGGAIGLALNYLSFALASAWKARTLRLDADVIFCYQLSPAFMAWPATILKKRLKKPLLLYCLDLWPESLKTILKNDASLPFRAVKHICTSLYRQCDRILVTAESFLPYFRDVHGIEAEALAVLPQFADDAYLAMDLSATDNGITDFVMLGNLGAAQDLPALLQAAAKLKNRNDWRLHLVGGGSALEETKALAARMDLSEQIVFHGRRPSDEMPAFYRLADICILTLQGDSLIGQTVPARLQGYLAAGKPVLAMTDGPAGSVIAEAGCGSSVKSGDSEGFAALLSEYLDHPERYAHCGENARQYFETHYTKTRHMHQLTAHLSELTEE